jgi:hypothetical protein
MVASALGPGPLGNGNAAWSPDGRTLTVPCHEGGAIQQYVFEPAAPGLRPARRIDGPHQGGTWIVYNPAGDRFVRRGWGGGVHLFDAVSGRLLFSTHSTGYADHVFDQLATRAMSLTAPGNGWPAPGSGIAMIESASGRWPMGANIGPCYIQGAEHLITSLASIAAAGWRPLAC